MPTYQYACTDCSHAFDQVQKFSDDALSVCPTCEGRLRKIYNAVGVVFKGSGFYRNDSRPAAAPGGDTPATADSSGSSSSSESSSTKKTEAPSTSGTSDKPAKKSEASPAKASSTPSAASS